MNVEIEVRDTEMKILELLAGVLSGHRYTFTLQGRAIADLVPTQMNRLTDSQEAVDRMLHFINCSTGKIKNINSLVGSGRD